MSTTTVIPEDIVVLQWKRHGERFEVPCFRDRYAAFLASRATVPSHRPPQHHHRERDLGAGDDASGSLQLSKLLVAPGVVFTNASRRMVASRRMLDQAFGVGHNIDDVIADIVLNGRSRDTHSDRSSRREKADRRRRELAADVLAALVNRWTGLTYEGANAKVVAPAATVDPTDEVVGIVQNETRPGRSADVDKYCQVDYQNADDSDPIESAATVMADLASLVFSAAVASRAYLAGGGERGAVRSPVVCRVTLATGDMARLNRLRCWAGDLSSLIFVSKTAIRPALDDTKGDEHRALLLLDRRLARGLLASSNCSSTLGSGIEKDVKYESTLSCLRIALLAEGIQIKSGDAGGPTGGLGGTGGEKGGPATSPSVVYGVLEISIREPEAEDTDAFSSWDGGGNGLPLYITDPSQTPAIALHLATFKPHAPMTVGDAAPARAAHSTDAEREKRDRRRHNPADAEVMSAASEPKGSAHTGKEKAAPHAYERHTHKQLQDLCRRRNLSTGGKALDLMERLLMDD